MRTFVIPGGRARIDLMVACLDANVCGILLTSKEDATSLEQDLVVTRGLRIPCFSYTNLSARPSLEQDGDAYAKRAQYLEMLLADPRVFFLASRTSNSTAFNHVILIETIVTNSVNILAACAPSRLIIAGVPHSLQTFIFVRCCELQGIPVQIVDVSPIPNRYWIHTDMNQLLVNSIFDSECCPLALDPETVRFIAQQRANAGTLDSNGTPISRIGMSNYPAFVKPFCWKREISYITRLVPKKASTILLLLFLSTKKWKLARSFLRFAVADRPKCRYIIFFLHYQPEKSSLPEGLGYAQQWLAIRDLAACLPIGWKVLVREHPATFILQYQLGVRTSDFYESISTLSNVILSDINVDTFDLIDNAEATATLTGKVGFQSIVRGKPAIAFGLANFKDHPGCYRVNNLDDLKAAISSISTDAHAVYLTDHMTTDYLHWVEAHTVKCETRVGRTFQETRTDAFVKLFSLMLARHKLTVCRFESLNATTQKFLPVESRPFEITDCDSKHL